MITAELVDYLLENVSSTEFDVIVYSVLHSDWDGRIHVTPLQIASAIGTKEKYVKYLLKNFLQIAVEKYLYVKNLKVK